ncbi:hypothetical protein CTI12_AA626030 [Artemisia annua]|uniref:Uncharacterized protein n=1 Tax=Artemisia annua TaxID=35608 RepID=A0A2U1KAC3_ARTAN|nr:hypothetical protein CTI12_AA626030 [Artemisia annua]
MEVRKDMNKASTLKRRSIEFQDTPRGSRRNSTARARRGNKTQIPLIKLRQDISQGKDFNTYKLMKNEAARIDAFGNIAVNDSNNFTGKLEEEEAASSKNKCMTPLVSSILGFPEEKGKAWVT